MPGLVVATVAAILATGCSGVPHRSPSVATTGAASPSATPSAKLPNPFTIVARYTAASLGLKQPIDLAIGPDGNLYVTDFVSQTVTVLSPAGKVLRRWGQPGRGPGQLSFHKDVDGNPHAAIAVGPDGKVYVSDGGNSRVEVFSPTGTFIRQFGSYGDSTNYQFLEVTDLALDASNDLYVVDRSRGSISKFSPSGKFVWRVGGQDSTDPDLSGEMFLKSVDSHGRVVVAGGSHRILYIEPRGHKVDSFSTEGLFMNNWGPCGVTVNNEGYTVVESCPDAGVNGPNPYQATLVFDRTHRLVGGWYGSPFIFDETPRFGPHGEAFALSCVVSYGEFSNCAILNVRVALPGA